MDLKKKLPHFFYLNYDGGKVSLIKGHYLYLHNASFFHQAQAHFIHDFPHQKPPPIASQGTSVAIEASPTDNSGSLVSFNQVAKVANTRAKDGEIVSHPSQSSKGISSGQWLKGLPRVSRYLIHN